MDKGRSLRAPARPDDEEALWRANLAIIRRSLRLDGEDGRRRLSRLRQAIDREIDALARQRSLRAPAAPSSSVNESHAPLTWLDRRIEGQRRRRSELAALQKSVPARAPGCARSAVKPEAQGKPARSDPIMDLARKGRLNDDQQRAALEIRQIFEAVSRGARASTLELGCRIDRGAWRLPDVPAHLAEARRRRFLPWAESLRRNDPAALDIAIRIAVFGLPVFRVARGHRIGWAKCLESLVRGLDHYWAVGREARVTAGNPGIPRPGSA